MPTPALFDSESIPAPPIHTKSVSISSECVVVVGLCLQKANPSQFSSSAEEADAVVIVALRGLHLHRKVRVIELTSGTQSDLVI